MDNALLPDLREPDLRKPDAKSDLPLKDVAVGDVPPTTCAAVLGIACVSGSSSCGGNNFCFKPSAGAAYCTCSCTYDDPQTPLVNEDSCPKQPSFKCKVGVTSYLCQP